MHAFISYDSTDATTAPAIFADLSILNALYAADATVDWPIFHGDVDPAKHYAGPLTSAGVAFLFDEKTNANRDDYKDSQITPTVVLFKDGTLIQCYALDVLEKPEHCADVAESLGMHGVDDAVPLPGAGWELIHIDADAFTTLQALRDAYCTDEAEPTAAPDAEEAEPTAAPDAEEAVIEPDAEEAVIEPDAEVLEMYGDAVIRAPYNETDYVQDFTVTLGALSTSKNWKTQTMPLGAFVARLCQHREGDKDGPSFVLSDMVNGQRLKNAVKMCTAIGLDLDTGTPSAVVDAALKKLGCMAVRYTTHSHMKSKTEFKKDKLIKFAGDADVENDELIQRFLTEEMWDQSIVKTASYSATDHTDKGIVIIVEHAPMPKHRIVVPMPIPYEIAKEGKTQKDAVEKWAKVPAALAARLGLPFDRSCTDPSRLFYFPRHAKGKPFEASVFGGPLFDYRTLVLEDPLEKYAEEFKSGGSKSVTEEGKALGRWSVVHATGFQIADVIVDHAPDRERGSASQGITIECPFDEDHSNSGDRDDKACFAVNAQEGVSAIFTISCRHESCRNKTGLDMLGRMIKDGWFSREVIDDPKYTATVIEEDGSPAPKGEAVLPLTVSEVEKGIGDLSKTADGKTKPIDLDELEGFLDQIAAQPDESLRAKLYTAAEGGLKAKHKSMVAASRKKANARWKTQSKAEAEIIPEDADSKKILKALNATAPRPLVLPQNHFGHYSLMIVDGTPWITMRMEGMWQPICTVIALTGGIKKVDRHSEHAYRVEVRMANGKWISVDLDAGKVAQKYSGDILDKLGKAGMAVAPGMHDRVMGFIGAWQPDTIDVCHRPGARDGGFLLPTGETLLTDTPMELSSDVRLKGVQKAGSLDEYVDGLKPLFNLANAIPQQFCFFAGLAGNLTAFAEDASLLYSLEGTPGSSKSTSQSLAVGHWGNPKLGAGLFVRGNTTPGALETPFEIASGTAWCMDEVTGMPAAILQNFAYLTEGGEGRRRLKRNGDEQDHRKWTGQTVIISAEVGFAQRLEQESVALLGGVAARMLPIGTSEETRIPDEAYDQIKVAFSANFGLSGPAFIKAVDAEGYAKDPAKIHKRVADLIAKLPGTQGVLNVQRKRAARMVAYPWLAALIAQRAGLVPAEFDVAGLMIKMWAAALKSDMAPVDPAVTAVTKLCDTLISGKGANIVEYENRLDAHREAYAYFDAPAPEGHTGLVYVVRVNKLAELSGGTADKKAIMARLETLNLLARQKTKDGSRRTWNGFPGLGKDTQYIVVKASEIDATGGENPLGAMLKNAVALTSEYDMWATVAGENVSSE
ncbi:MAG: DUF927 domain-containing protein [Pseudomonadota bacterium]